MIVDVSAFVGPYPYRHLRDSTPQALLREMDRVGIERAWVAHLPSAFYRDPLPGTEALQRLLETHRDRLAPVPTVHPGLPDWERDAAAAAKGDAPAVRVYPMHQSLEPAGTQMLAAAARLAAAGLPLVLTVRFEDVRQRHPYDVVPDLPPSAVRSLVRAVPALKVLVTHAEASFVEEVHFGLTPDEAARVLWDITWIWGPPQNDLGRLIRTVGVDRFALGTGMPLRIPDAGFARLDLLELSDQERAAVLGGNLDRWRAT